MDLRPGLDAVAKRNHSNITFPFTLRSSELSLSRNMVTLRKSHCFLNNMNIGKLCIHVKHHSECDMKGRHSTGSKQHNQVTRCKVIT